MNFCCVRSCKNYGTVVNNLELYPLPLKDEERNLWARAFGLSREDLNAYTRICSAHFIRKSFLDQNKNKTMIQLSVDEKYNSATFTNPPVNGANTIFVVNNQETPHIVPGTSVIRPSFLNNANAVKAPSNSHFYMAFPNGQDIGSYVLHIPEVRLLI